MRRLWWAAGRVRTLDDMADIELVVVDKTEVAHGVVSVTLADPAGRRLPDWAPGAHLDLALPGGMVRQYSLCGDRFDPTVYRVGVLREPAGRGGSAYVHERLRVGDRVGIGGPRNNFRMVPAPEYLFIAGGIGITPLLPMIHQAQLVGARWRLLYGGRTRASMAFLDELARYPAEHVTLRPQDEFGLLDLDAWLPERPGPVKTYCCGPGPLLDALARRCADWPPGCLRTERFTPTEVPARASEFELRLRRSGRTLRVGPDQSILDALASAGISVLSSCARGVCGTCETAVLEGRPEHRDSILDDDERAAGECMFICVSRASSARLVLDL